MGFIEFVHLFELYDGQIEIATESELREAGRGIDPAIARRMARAEYERKKRIKNNENIKQKIRQENTEDSAGRNFHDRHSDCLFGNNISQ